MRGLIRLVCCVCVVSWLACAPVGAQVRCAMPNGVLITQQLGGCPQGATQISGDAPIKPDIDAVERSTKALNAEIMSARVDAAVKSEAAQKSGEWSIAVWFLPIAAMVVVLAVVKELSGMAGKSLYCTTCGHQGPAKTVTRGSLLIEIILWFCFLVPGLIYSIWRHTSRYKACTSCGGSAVVPLSSPVAVAARQSLGGEA